MPITVKEIVKKYLEENGFDGLHNEDYCGCEKDDLCPCGECFEYCEPGYKIKDESGEYDFIISTNKE